MKKTILLFLSVLIFGVYLAKGHRDGVLPPAGKYTVTVEKPSYRPPAARVQEINYFETPRDVENWACRSIPQNSVAMQWSDEFASQGKHSMKVQWNSRRWGEIILLHFPHDWRGWTAFAFDVYSPVSSPFRLELWLGDRMEAMNARPAVTRYVSVRTIRPGVNRLRFNIPRNRGTWKLVSLQVRTGNAVFYVDNMRIER